VTPKKSVQLSGIVVAESSVSSIDADEGVLMYRGYDIADIAEHSTYEDTAYLLVHGELPDAAERGAFVEALAQRTLPDATAEAIDRSAASAAPMDLLRTAASSLSFGSSEAGATDRESGLLSATRLIAQLPTMIARHHRRRQGLEPVAPDASLTYAENFLAMLFGERPNERHARVFDIAMILHAEHEMNASTFTARVVAGTGADLTSAVVAAIAALSGPLHGGANAAAMGLFERWGSAERTPDEVRAMLERKEKLYGFGHPRVRSARADPEAHLRGALGAGGRPELVRDHRGGRAHGVRREAALPERRPLLSVGLPLPRHSDRPLHAGLRREPGGGLGGARARAAVGQPDHPALGVVRRRAAPSLSTRMTLAEAAERADALAGEGNERELAQLRAEWDEQIEASARTSDFRERAVAYRAIGQFRFRSKRELLRRGLQDESPAVRGSALLALERLSRDHPGDVNDVRAILHELLTHDGNEAVRRLAVVSLKNGSSRPDTVQLLGALAGDDEQPRELREAAAKVAQSLRRKAVK
jgi:citrate synthase